MRKRFVRFVPALLGLCALVLSVPAAYAHCEDPAGECAGQPCEAEISCHTDADCGPGSTCVPWEPYDPCFASTCYCDNGNWICSDDCSDRCSAQVPAVSERGSLALALCVAASSSLVILWRRRSRA